MHKPIGQWLIEWGPDRKPGFVVVVLGALAPTVVHDTIEDAEKEAKRLIAGLPTTVDQTALVLPIGSAITRSKAKAPPIEVVRLAATSPPPARDFGIEEGKLYITGTGLLKGGVSPSTPPAHKFKVGDRVYYVSRDGNNPRVYGVVCERRHGQPYPKKEENPVFAEWVNGYGWMPGDCVFHDLRTVAGGGVLKLRHACSGKRRDGRIVTLTTHDPASVFPFSDGCDLWSESGEWSIDTPADPRDIVELIEDGA
jgi:hypothetical protein